MIPDGLRPRAGTPLRRLNYLRPSYIPKATRSGKFLKGKGYEVLDKGRKARFTKGGKVTLRYKLKGKVYKIACRSGCVYDELKDFVVKQLRKHLYVPESMQLKSYKLELSKKTEACTFKVRYSALNLFGVRVARTAKGYLEDGQSILMW